MLLLTVQEAAREAKVSSRTIRRLIQSGRLQASDFGTGGRRHDWRITPQALATVSPVAASPMPPARPTRRRHRPSPPPTGRFSIWP